MINNSGELFIIWHYQEFKKNSQSNFYNYINWTWLNSMNYSYCHYLKVSGSIKKTEANVDK